MNGEEYATGVKSVALVSYRPCSQEERGYSTEPAIRTKIILSFCQMIDSYGRLDRQQFRREQEKRGRQNGGDTAIGKEAYEIRTELSKIAAVKLRYAPTTSYGTHGHILTANAERKENKKPERERNENALWPFRKAGRRNRAPQRKMSFACVLHFRNAYTFRKPKKTTKKKKKKKKRRN